MYKKIIIAALLIAIGSVITAFGVIILMKDKKPEMISPDPSGEEDTQNDGIGDTGGEDSVTLPEVTPSHDLPAEDEANPDNSAQDVPASEPADTPDESSDTDSTAAENNPSSSSVPTSRSDIDFEAWQKINDDIYAWVTVPGSDISFPVVQHPTKNEYYLRHDYEKDYNRNGAIFTENYNSKDFTDFMTVMYGHTMRSGAMFAGVHQYKDREFFDEHRYITVYTPDKTFKYEVFASYIYDDRHLLLTFDMFESDIMRNTYLNYVKGVKTPESNVDTDISVTADDRLLVLSCCTFTTGERYIVHAVLVEEDGVALR